MGNSIKKYITFVSISLCVFWMGCSGSSSSNNYDIQGIVFEENGTTPIGGVVIDIDESRREEITNADGGFKFKDHPGVSFLTFHFTWRSVDQDYEIDDIPDDISRIKLVFRYRAEFNEFALDDIDYE